VSPLDAPSAEATAQKATRRVEAERARVEGLLVLFIWQSWRLRLRRGFASSGR